MTTDQELYDQIRREQEADDRAYSAAVRALTPTQRRAWGRVWHAYEGFDGETGIALSVLRRMKAQRRLR